MKCISSLALTISMFLVGSLQICAGDTSLLLVLLEQGNVRVAQYPLLDEGSELKSLFTLDLADKNNSYSVLLCNPDTNGVVIVRSDNDVMCDYCLNWGAMLGVDLTQPHAVAHIPVTVVDQEHGGQKLVVAGTLRESNINIEIPLASQVKSAVALAVPTELIEKMSIDESTMPFSQCCRLGIIMAKGRNEVVQSPVMDQEIEFDSMLDSMLKDGTIKVKEVSPFMAALRNVGSTIFVKCLAAKQALDAWWHKTFDNKVTVRHAKSSKHAKKR